MSNINVLATENAVLTRESTDSGIGGIVEGFEDVILANRKSILPYH